MAAMEQGGEEVAGGHRGYRSGGSIGPTEEVMAVAAGGWGRQ